MQYSFVKTLFSFIVCVTFLLVSGCQPGNPDGRENVSGMISLNGQPLEGSARIVFESLEGDPRSGGSGQIMSGKFFLTQQDGVKPGKYRVRIYSTITYDKTTNSPATKETFDYNEYKMVLVPPEFNDSSNLEFEAIKGKKNIFDYNILTNEKPKPIFKIIPQ